MPVAGAGHTRRQQYDQGFGDFQVAAHGCFLNLLRARGLKHLGPMLPEPGIEFDPRPFLDAGRFEELEIRQPEVGQLQRP